MDLLATMRTALDEISAIASTGFSQSELDILQAAQQSTGSDAASREDRYLAEKTGVLHESPWLRAEA